MYGINEKVYKNLITYFTNDSNIKKVTLFGSRAKGNAKINSDIDICIEYIGKSKSKIIEDIDELVGIYSCDVLFYDSLNNEIKNQIGKYGITIYPMTNDSLLPSS